MSARQAHSHGGCRCFMNAKLNVILVIAIVESLVFGPLARADDYPTKPVRFVVAIPAGGNVDLVARLVGQKLTDALGRPFVIDNRGGAGGVIAEELVSRSAADGYTILMVSIAHIVNPSLNKKLPYDSFRDFMPVSLVVSVPNVLVVHNSLGVQSVPELIALAKAKPGQLNYASSHGTSLHLAGELFKTMAGVDIVNVNYKSGGLAVPDLEAGRVQMAFSVITTALTLVKSGRIRALAVTSAKRSMVMPELPAIAEFVPGFELTGWQGILAPAGTSRAIVSRLSGEIARIMRVPEVRNKLVGMGADPVGSTPEEFAAFRKAELAKVTKLVLIAGIKADD
jgi:tripartite-type tricarboxylate transporter receptor subunit TctC